MPTKHPKEERINRLFRKHWNPRRVLTGYFSVYITEGMVRSIMILLPVYLLSGAFGLSHIEVAFIVVVAYVPWHFKFLIGLGMDASPAIRGWRRRLYIVAGTIITLAGVMWLANTQLVWLGILPAVLVIMAGDALIDTGMDALLLDVMPPDWHGTGLGVGWGARAIGYTISAGLTWFVQAQWGWTAAIYLFCLYSLPALATIVIKEPPVTEERRPSKRVLAETFTNKWMLSWIGFAFLGCFIYVLDPTRGIISLVLDHVMGSEIFQAIMFMGAGTVIASFAMGRIIDKIGHKRGYYISLLGAAGSAALWFLLPSGTSLWLLVFSALLGFFGAFNFVSWEAILADTVPPEFTGFMWQYFMSWIHVAAFVSGIFISYMLGLGYQSAMLGIALVCLLGLVPARLIRTMRASKAHEVS